MKTTAQPVYLTDLHFEHQQWNNELSFFADEIKTFENRLQEIASRNSATETRAQVEQYQNKFILQRDVIDRLKHDIKLHENALAEYAQEHPVALDRVHFDDHHQLRDRMHDFRNLFDELKKNYFKFVMHWL